jgi:hypothetical protein
VTRGKVVLKFKYILYLFVISTAVDTKALMLGYSKNKTAILQFEPQSIHILLLLLVVPVTVLNRVGKNADIVKFRL